MRSGVVTPRNVKRGRIMHRDEMRCKEWYSMRRMKPCERFYRLIGTTVLVFVVGTVSQNLAHSFISRVRFGSSSSRA